MSKSKSDMKLGGCTSEQLAAIEALRKAITLATDSGLFDDMAGIVHPDVINNFCDAVKDTFDAYNGIDG